MSIGVDVANEIWDIVRGFVPKDELEDVALEIVDACEYLGVEDMDEAMPLWEDAGLNNTEDD